MAQAFWRTRNGLEHLRLGWRHFRRLLREERFRENLVDAARAAARRLGTPGWIKRVGQRWGLVRRETWDGSPHWRYQAEAVFAHAQDPRAEPPGAEAAGGERPLVFASACVDATEGGGTLYSGGIKQLECLVGLLRRHGVEAYMVTFDGRFEPWLREHQPHVSLAEYRDWLGAALAAGRPVRCVTSYAIARAFIGPAPAVYFWDMELALTDNHQWPDLMRLYGRGRIRQVAGFTRTIQAWHMARFHRPALNLPVIQDDALYRPDPAARRAGRVGYMVEGDHTERYATFLREFCAARGCDLEFVCLRGPEADIAVGMQACDFFVSMNLGKDLFWGEGLGMPQAEAMACGCVVLAFDLLGNREIILPGHNAILVPRYRVDLLAAELVRLAADTPARETMRTRSLELWHGNHRLEHRWPVVREFLELPPGEG